MFLSNVRISITESLRLISLNRVLASSVKSSLLKMEPTSNKSFLLGIMIKSMPS